MLAVPVGLLASAILVVNNVRDLETDRRAGKRTLAVRLGRERARTLYAGDARAARSSRRRCRGCSARCRPGCCCRWLAIPLAVPLVRTVRDAHRRAVAQRRARRHRAAPARLLRAAVGRAARELSGAAALEVVPVRLRLRAPLRTAWGELRERELLRVRLAWARRRLRAGRGRAARALRRRAARRGRGGARRLRGGAARRRAATPSRGDLLAACAAERDAPAGARGDRPRALGPRGAADGPAGRAPARRGRRAGGPGQRDDRRRGPRGRGGRRPPRRRRRGSAA